MMKREWARTAAAMAAATLAGLMWAGAAHAGSATYVFDYPAIAGPGVQHPAVATLTLTEITGGVSFTLTPDWSVIGTGAQIDELDLAYQGPTTGVTLVGGTAPPIASFDPADSAAHAGYAADATFMMIHWDNTHQGDHFDYPDTSSWSFMGVALSDFTGTAAWANNKISPVAGVLSGQGFKGDSQNWVAAIPEPSTYAMLLAGLGIVALVTRRRA